jgi:hypothetical protein
LTASLGSWLEIKAARILATLKNSSDLDVIAVVTEGEPLVLLTNETQFGEHACLDAASKRKTKQGQTKQRSSKSKT